MKSKSPCSCVFLCDPKSVSSDSTDISLLIEYFSEGKERRLFWSSIYIGGGGGGWGSSFANESVTGVTSQSLLATIQHVDVVLTCYHNIWILLGKAVYVNATE